MKQDILTWICLTIQLYSFKMCTDLRATIRVFFIQKIVNVSQTNCHFLFIAHKAIESIVMKTHYKHWNTALRKKTLKRVNDLLECLDWLWKRWSQVCLKANLARLVYSNDWEYKLFLGAVRCHAMCSSHSPLLFLLSRVLHLNESPRSLSTNLWFQEIPSEN